MSDPKLLDGYLTQPGLAVELDCCPRTISRYENQPDGLPFVRIGGRKLYRIESVRAWIAALEHKPNPKRATVEEARKQQARVDTAARIAQSIRKRGRDEATKIAEGA